MITNNPQRDSVSETVKNEVGESIKRFLLIAEKRYGKTYSMPSVSYDLKTVVAGTASYSRWHIEVNPRMLVENKDDYLINTIGHEVAHLITSGNHHGKRMGHRKEWKDTMAVFGLEPEIYHHYKTHSKPRKRMQRFTYVCPCSYHHYLTVKRRRAVEREGTVYCLRCRHILKKDGFSETEQEANEWRESERKHLQKEAGKVSSNAAKKRAKQTS
jgi:SprT protein